MSEQQNEAAACAMPRKVMTGEAGPAPSLHRIITSLDLDGCSVSYIVMPMNEFEQAGGVTFDTWPRTVQVRMNKEIAEFQERHPKAELRATTQGVHDRCCVLALHWKQKQ